MASSATALSQWLPGFDPDTVEFPDLFDDRDVPTTCHSSASSAPPSCSSTDESGGDALPVRSGVNWRASTAVTTEDIPRMLWTLLESGDFSSFSGPVAKFDANLAVINLLRTLEAAKRPPSQEDAAVLRRFTGWGGLLASFNLEGDDKPWVARARTLRNVLSDDEYESARASVNNSHYTGIHMIEAIWHAIERFGFSGGRILEPSAGIGHFIGAMPNAVPRLPSRSISYPVACSRRSMRRLT